MYATLSDLLADLFGFYLPLPIQTFGFFMAISFVGAYITTSRELKRKESLGLIPAIQKVITKNERITQSDFIVQTLLGAIIGYKVLYVILNYSLFVQDTQGIILSMEGNLWGGLIGGGWAFYQKWLEDKKLSLLKPEKVTITVHPHEHMTNILFIAGIAGLLGAKIFHNLENLDDFMRDPIHALLSFSGLTFYGGLIIAAIGVLYYTGKNNIPPLHMIDATAPGLMLAYGIGRIGCQLSGDGDWGIVNTAPKPEWMSFLPDWMWSFKYPNNVINEGIPIPGCSGSHCFELPEAVFPTPFYEVIMAISLFFILWTLRTRIQIPGLLFSIYLVVNGIERFLIEKIRVNSTYDIWGNKITQAELISSGLVILGLIGIIYLLSKRTKSNTA